MSNFEAFTILESNDMQKGNVLDPDALYAAEILYELANGQCSSPAYTDKKPKNKSRKRKFVNDGSKSRSNKNVENSNLQNVDAPKMPYEFPFSVIHLLSAVRSALVTPNPGKAVSKEVTKKNLPLLNIDQIVLRVRTNPGDPLILECEDHHLVELVKGVLNVFSSLTVYDKSNKTWRWAGPLTRDSSQSCNKIETSHTTWGISQENLIKLVNEFHIWWSITSLPEPPLQLMQDNDFQTRFDKRKKVNQCTIGQRCDEVKAYFRREEAIRYSIPEKGFLYTTLDGKKSAAAPLRKPKNDNSKTYAKSRGHYIFKAERPPYFSLLSLVRDAAARLPGGMGTRADICSLIRDSQFIIDDICEKTVKQLVSGALDRLQSEVDPCVEYTGRSGLWVYLHKDRDENDFVENGTVSVRTKRVKSRAN